MLCGNCPISLLCYTNRIGLYPTAHTYFCPYCAKIVHIYIKKGVYTALTFSCELSKRMYELVKDYREIITDIHSYHRLNPCTLYVAKCLKCDDKLYTVPGIIWNELE